MAHREIVYIAEMRFLLILRSILGIAFMLPFVAMIVLWIGSSFGWMDDGGYVSSFSSWLITGFFAWVGIKLNGPVEE